MSLKRIAILCTVGIIVSAIILFFLAPVFVGHASSRTVQKQTGIGLPTRLRIPRIGVDAAIDDVGLTSAGAMAVPAGPTDVAWFDLGSRPGEKGSAVIAGHEGWKDGIAAVFDNLSALRTGDLIYVENDQGVTATFMVRTIRVYDQNAEASAVFSSNDGKAHLNLITCEGAWNAAQKSYSNRLVIFTDEIK